MLLFSVVVPTYNRADLLAAALDSAAAQTFRDFEVIVADDGSTDGTVEVAGRYPFVRYVRQENAGPGAARNLGLAHATGRYVAFLDSDDLWFPWTLATYADAIELHGEPAVVIGHAAEFRDVGRLDVRLEPLVLDSHADFFAAAARTCWYGTPALVVRLDSIASVGGFTSKRVNAEDLDLQMRLGTAPGCIIVDRPVTFAYRQHPGSAVSSTARTVDGLSILIENEREGRYPGGHQRRRQRLELLTRLIRPHILAAVRHGHLRAGWQLYRRTLLWNLRLLRGRYILGVPLVALAAGLRILPGVTKRDE